jgi:hypothetical protein
LVSPTMGGRPDHASVVPILPRGRPWCHRVASAPATGVATPSLLRTRRAASFPGPFYGRRPDAVASAIRLSSKRCRRIPVRIPPLDTSAARIRRRHNPTQAPCPNSKH